VKISHTAKLLHPHPIPRNTPAVPGSILAGRPHLSLPCTIAKRGPTKGGGDRPRQESHKARFHSPKKLPQEKASPEIHAIAQVHNGPTEVFYVIHLPSFSAIVDRLSYQDGEDVTFIRTGFLDLWPRFGLITRMPTVRGLSGMEGLTATTPSQFGCGKLPSR